MLTQANYYDSLMRDKLIERRAEMLQALINKNAVPDYADYCYKTGVIAGLSLAFELCDDVKEIVDNR
jgi:hypothetical protein